jgi:hypothetical protein
LKHLSRYIKGHEDSHLLCFRLVRYCPDVVAEALGVVAEQPVGDSVVEKREVATRDISRHSSRVSLAEFCKTYLLRLGAALLLLGMALLLRLVMTLLLRLGMTLLLLLGMTLLLLGMALLLLGMALLWLGTALLSRMRSRSLHCLSSNEARLR